jgi:transcriptional regulator with XRE-family HTH domain
MRNISCQIEVNLQVSFAGKLKSLRASYNLTQKEVSEKIGIAQRQYCALETGTNEPGLHSLLAIANFYRVSMDFLLDRPFGNAAYEEPGEYANAAQKKPLIFLRTFPDTEADSAKLIIALLEAESIPVSIPHIETDGDKDRRKLIGRALYESDYYMLALSPSRPDDVISAAELEYVYAANLNKPAGVFLRRPDGGETGDRLAGLRKSMSEKFPKILITGEWETADELCGLACRSVLQLKRRRPPGSLARANDLTSEHLLREAKLLEREKEIAEEENEILRMGAALISKIENIVRDANAAGR